MNVGDVDLFSADSFLRAVPHEYFAFLRREAPVAWHMSADGYGHWAITRYADIEFAERHPQLFSSIGTTIAPGRPSEAERAGEGHFVTHSDAPHHTFLRRVVMRGFTPKAIQGLEGRIRDLMHGAVDAVMTRGACDLTDLVSYMPVEIVGEIVGLPPADRHKMARWANMTFGAHDRDVSSDEQGAMAAMEMFALATHLIATKRAGAGDDILSRIAKAVDEETGESITDFDAGCLFFILCTAGNETTRTLIANGLYELLQRPEVMAELRDDPSLIPQAVEEMLRYTTPVHAFCRRVTEDLELNGACLKAGDRVALWYCSGNRDETMFPDAGVFDIRRENARSHLAFGARGSTHMCLGMSIARMEVVIAFEVLLERLADLRMAGPLVRLRSNFTNGVKSMPVSFAAGSPRHPDDIPDIAPYCFGAIGVPGDDASHERNPASW